MNIIEKQGIIKTWFNEFLTQHNFNILEELITTHFTFHSINNGIKKSNIVNREEFEESMAFYLHMIHPNRWVINNLIEKEDCIFVEYTGYLTYTDEFITFTPENRNKKETGIMKFHFMDGKIEKLYWEVNSVV
ncbi:nuclear transport factor 2 family protein [Bacillus cereus group sp. MYBK245-2]|uniref:SnoaL-like polyketide cyclase n=1 Tax=Bacillus pacificus TaxID=2026187 RepID=A0A1Y5ZGB8_9BACI|nr:MULTISPECIES: nuclear transport factor 2 family protein [Bacteria]MDQ4681701.1 hypothetical protein [Stenotrophomonas maltophilia group sp. RNC7]UTG90013.1 hypothetical protein MON12_09165 [Bacillus pacificus]SMD95449.1 SnoaL-like polyketide cyclase [Bacillus pacificus]